MFKNVFYIVVTNLVLWFLISYLFVWLVVSLMSIFIATKRFSMSNTSENTKDFIFAVVYILTVTVLLLPFEIPLDHDYQLFKKIRNKFLSLVSQKIISFVFTGISIMEICLVYSYGSTFEALCFNILNYALVTIYIFMSIKTS